MVERQLPKLNVAGSNPVIRSIIEIIKGSVKRSQGLSFCMRNLVKESCNVLY